MKHSTYHKETIHFTSRQLLIRVPLCIVIIMSLWISPSYGKGYKVQGSPNMDIYYCLGRSKSYVSDVEAFIKFGRYIGSTDSLGNGEVELSSLDRQVPAILFAVKSGYTPVILFDKFKTFDKKKVYFIELLERDSISCFEYYAMATETEDIDEKREHLLNAVMQDHRDENGVKSLALTDYAIISVLNDEDVDAVLFRLGIKLNENDELMVAKWNWLRNDENKQKLNDVLKKNSAAYDERRRQETNAILMGIAESMQAIASSLGTSSPTTYYSASETSNSTTSSTNTNKTSNQSATLSSRDCNNYQNAYSGYINSIMKYKNIWDDDVKYDIKNNTYSHTSVTQNGLREILRGIDDLKKKVSGRGCSIQYNSELEAWAKSTVNFRPNW